MWACTTVAVSLKSDFFQHSIWGVCESGPVSVVKTAPTVNVVGAVV